MSSDFLKQKTTLRYPTDFLIGDLLVRAGVVTAKQLDEAVRLAGNKHVHVGQMLVMARYLSQRNLQAAVDAQSAVRDRTIDMNAAVKALKQACRTSITFAEACHSQDSYTSGDNPTNRLGEILLEAGLINRDQFHKAMQRSLATGLPLGRILVLNNALGEPLLLTVLELQVRVRDEIMTRDEAIDQLKSICENNGEALSAEEAAQIQQALRPPRRKGIRLGEMLVLAGLLQEADVMNALELGLSNNMQIGQVIVNQGFISTEILDSALRLQELVDSDQMSGEQAAATLGRVHETGVSVDEAVNQIGLGLTEAGVKELSYQDLLTLARVVSEEDIYSAFELIRQTPEYTAQLLAITGHIQPITAEATVRCHWLINNGYLNQDDALVALDFCLQKQAESEITFDDALEELGWSLGEGTLAEGGEDGVEQGLDQNAAEEESSSMFGESLEADSQDLEPQEIYADESSQDEESVEPETDHLQSAEIEAKEERTPEIESEEVSLESLEPEEIEALQEESLKESLKEALLEEAIEEVLEEALEEALIEEPLSESEPSYELPVEETALEEPIAEETFAEEEPAAVESELSHPHERSEEEFETSPQMRLDEEEPILFEESLTLLESEPQEISQESEEEKEIEVESKRTNSLQSLLSGRHDVGSETVDSLPAIGEQHGYLSESLSEPFENPDSASLMKSDEVEESNGNGRHVESLIDENVVSLEDEGPLATDFSNLAFEPSDDLMELEENFAVLDDSDAIQLVDSIEEIEEHEPVLEAEAESEDFAPEPTPERGPGLGSLFAADQKPTNGKAKDGYEKEATTGNGQGALGAGTKAGASKGMSLKSLLQSYNTDSPEDEAASEVQEEAPLPPAAEPTPVPVAAAVAAKKDELILSEKDQMILAAASSLTATPEEIKAAALILAGTKAPALPTSPAQTSPTARASAPSPVPQAPAPLAKPSSPHNSAASSAPPQRPVPASNPALAREKAPVSAQAKAPMRTAGQLLSGAVQSPSAAPQSTPTVPAKPTAAQSATPAPKAVEVESTAKPTKPQVAAKPVADSESAPEELNSVLGEAFVRLAESYYEQGNYPEAEKLYARILTLREKELGMKNPLLLNDLNNLAGVLCVQGKFSEAEMFVQRSVNIVESHEPDNMLKLADGLNTLAGVYYQQDKYDQCEPLLERALRLRQRALGEDHPDIADNLRDYAKFLKKVNRPEEAEKMYAQAKAVLAKAMKNAAR